MKEIIRSKLFITYAVYFALITLLRFNWEWQLIGFWIGGLLGLGFEMVDRLVHVYYVKPKEALSIAIKRLIDSKKFKEAAILLYRRRDEQVQLSTRSVFFMVAWVPISFYVITSSGSMLASGLVMGIGLHLLYEIYEDWGSWDKIIAWMFWQIKRPVTQKEAKIAMGVFGLCFLVFSLMLT